MATRHDDLLTLQQVAEIFRVTPQTVKKYIYSGRLVSVKTPGGHHRVWRADVEALLSGAESKGAEARVGEREYLGIIRALLEVVEELCDTFERGHGERVAAYARGLARGLGLDEAEQQQVWLSGLLHDVGKLMVDPQLLRKEGRLTRTQFEAVQQHAVHGENIVNRRPELASLAPTVRHHHERLDGSGYPDGLAGDDIPLSAQIVGIAEAYDSMRSDAVYRDGMRHEKAADELLARVGTCYDRRLVSQFLESTN